MRDYYRVKRISRDEYPLEKRKSENDSQNAVCVGKITRLKKNPATCNEYYKHPTSMDRQRNLPRMKMNTKEGNDALFKKLTIGDRSLETAL